MNLLAVTTSFPATEDDFRGRFISEWAQTIQSFGARIEVVGPARLSDSKDVSYTGYGHVGALLKGGGAPEQLQRRPLRNSLIGAAISVEMTRIIRRRQKKADLVVAHWLLPSLSASVFAGINANQAIHGYAHGGDIALLETLPNALGQSLSRSMDRRAAGITFVSHDLQTRFNRVLGRAPKGVQTVIPMGITRPPMDPAFLELINQVAGDRPIVATLGRMVGIKGLDTLLEALINRPDVLWVAAGSGPERSRLIETAGQRGVSLYAPGQIGPAEREALLSAATVFVQPSRAVGKRQEGCPVALSEALAAGTPSIITSTGGMTSIGQQSGCYMVPSDDSRALRTGLDMLLDKPEKRAKMAAEHRAFGCGLCWEILGHAHWAALQDSLAR